MTHLKLFLVRHGMSPGNQEQRMMGQLSDGLCEVGRQQVKRLADWAGRESLQVTALYSSPSQRAVETAQLFLQNLHSQGNSPAVAQIESRSDLLELHLGVLQGLTWVEAQQHFPELCRQLESSADWLPIPGAETPLAGRDRAQRFLSRLLDQHRNGDWVWVISHSGIMQHLVAAILGCDRTWGLTIPNTAVFEFWLDVSRWHRRDENRHNTALWQIRRFNQALHLER